MENNYGKNNIELSEQYYKNHKNLLLFSGLLFAYEFIGISIPTKPLPNVELEIKSPDAVPLLLIGLIFYFFYRTLVRWNQSDP